MDGMTLTKLKIIKNPKGDLFHVMKKSSNGFDGFGEAYFTTVEYNVVKGWKKHTEMALNLTVPIGEVEFVIYNEKNFKSIKLSKDNYYRLTVASGLWVAFKGIGLGTNLVLNMANIEHDPDEAINIELDELDYEWN